MTNKNLTIGLLITLVIAIIGIFTPAGKVATTMFGAAANCATTTCLSGGLRITDGVLESDGTFQVGSSGTALTQVLKGTCALIVQPGTSVQVASTTQPYDCAVTGAVSGDTVLAQFATSTGNQAFGASGQWTLIGAKASSTSGFITVTLRNDTGGTNSPSVSGIASSTTYLIMR